MVILIGGIQECDGRGMGIAYARQGAITPPLVENMRHLVRSDVLNAPFQPGGPLLPLCQALVRRTRALRNRLRLSGDPR